MPDKKLLTAAALTATLAVGGAGGALLGRPLISGAQGNDPTTTTSAPAPDEGAADHHPGARFGLDAAAKALGMGADELRTELRDGKTIADVAGEKKVDVQTVIDAVVADATARIDQRVSAGDLDADRAKELKDELADRVADFVNGEGRGFWGHRFGARLEGLSAAADALGMSASDLRTELRSGKTIADVAKEKNVDLQKVIDAMVADATKRIDERAAQAKEDLPQRISDLVNGKLPDHPGPGPRAGFRAGLEAAATALGVDESDLRDELRNGKTIADVAGEKHVDVQKVIDAMVADATKRIDQAVSDGDLAADRAAQLKSDLPTRIGDIVNGRGPGPGGPGGHPPFGPGPFGPGD